MWRVVEMYRDIPPCDLQRGHWVIGADLFETMRTDAARNVDRRPVAFGEPIVAVSTLMGQRIEIGPDGSGIRFEVGE